MSGIGGGKLGVFMCLNLNPRQKRSPLPALWGKLPVFPYLAKACP